MMVVLNRRQLIVGVTAGASGLGCASPGAPARAKVVVIGGGYGGATAAKYVRMWSDYKIDVVLIEPSLSFVSCPISNFVIAGYKDMVDITRSYEALHNTHGVIHVCDLVVAVNAGKKTVTLAGGNSIGYDKLIMSPGVDVMWDSVQGAQAANASGQVLQAWKAGRETLGLRQQLEAMPDGGVFAITIPEVPYRCPPGPYERACLVASYFKAAKPRAKVLILDANPDVTSKGALFKSVWANAYKGMIEYLPQHQAVALDVKNGVIKFDIQEDVKAQVLNVLPSMCAGQIAVQTGLANANGRWCHVDFLTFESTVAKDIYVIGDAIQTADAMPKSGHMANNQAKVCASAIVAQLSGQAVNDQPMLINTCYSYVSPTEAIHVASVHEYVATEKTYKPVAGAGGLSSAPSALEGRYAQSWASSIWADSLT